MNRKNLNAIFVQTKNIDVILKNKITKKKTRNTLRKVTWEKWAWKLDGVSGVLGHVPKFDPPKNQAHCLSVRPRRCWMLKRIPKRETPVTTSGDTSKNNPSNWQVRALMSQWMTSIEWMNDCRSTVCSASPQKYSTIINFQDSVTNWCSILLVKLCGCQLHGVCKCLRKLMSKKTRGLWLNSATLWYNITF